MKNTKKKFEITLWEKCLGLNTRLADYTIESSKTGAVKYARECKKKYLSVFPKTLSVWYEIKEV